LSDPNPYVTPASQVEDASQQPEQTSALKKLLMILGAIFAILVVIVGIALAYFAYTGGALDKESKAYADSAIPAITANWDMAELQNRLSPEFKTTLKSGDLEKLYAQFRRLGPLRKYNGVRGDATIGVTPNGKMVTARYIGSAEFETGPAEVLLALIRHGDQWQILGFRINSRVFLEPNK
jgi:hypothetical protein